MSGPAVLLLLAAGALVAPAAAEDGGNASAQFRQGGTGPVASAAATPVPRQGESIQLSDERTFTRWAYVLEPTRVHSSPDPSSEVVEKLTTTTHDGTPELVVALEQVIVDHVAWVRVRFKVRPNNLTGWVKRSDLDVFNLIDTRLEINRKRFRATLFRDNRRVWSARVGVGESRWKTPAGRFYVRQRVVPANKNSVYGVFAFGTSATSPKLTDWPGGGIIGIHGTNQPGLIPGRISHGCIRVRNSRISKLRKLMPLGTPIEIK